MASKAPLIVHVNLAKGFRGGERQTQLLIRGLGEHGFRQRLVARRGEPLATRLADLDDLEIRPVAGNVLSACAALAGADLVHVHEARALQAAFLRRMLGGAPYLVTRRVQHGPAHNWRNRAMYRRAAGVAVLSAAIGRSLHALDPGLQFTVIPSACGGLLADPARVADIRHRFDRGFLVGHVGALVDSHKGQLQIVTVARHLAASHPDFQFVLVGSGRDEHMLRRAARDLGNIHFAGEVADVGNWLAAFDVFIYPSRHEGLGSVLLDAMAAGLPLVATTVGGIPEVITPGVNGLLCEPDDIPGLTAALLTLHADAGLRQRMGDTNQRRAETFSPAAMTRRYTDLYRGLLSRRNGVHS